MSTKRAGNHRDPGGAMNDLKVQVDSRQDVAFLRAEASKYLRDNKVDPEQEDSAKIVADNVQVNGVDFGKVSEEEEIESVDEALVAQLEQVQQETEQLLQRVVHCRRTVPQKMADHLSSRLSSFELNLDAANNLDAVVTETDAMPEPVSQSTLAKLEGGVQRVMRLHTDVPATLAKLERAHTVLTEEGRKRIHPNPSTVSNDTFGGDADPTDAFGSLITRHRRTSHQFDLANKLTAAGHF